MSLRSERPHPTNVGSGSDERVSPAGLAKRYATIRHCTQYLCEPLEVEDMVIQSMPDASPTRWHLAHSSWFFESFVLLRARPDRRAFHYDFAYLFNSYYNSAGDQFPRPRRGLLSRPTIKEVYAYRHHVDAEMQSLIAELEPTSPYIDIIELGLHHEQQHQELILTDIKSVFACNPLYPVYRAYPRPNPTCQPELNWIDIAEDLYEIGHDGVGFAYDTEGPRHRVFVPASQIASRLVTAGDYIEFMEDGGYRRPEYWLSDGWAVVQRDRWRAPLYWENQDGVWWQFTLSGLRPVDLAEPVCHVSFYEANAFANWAGARLPTEAEWEIAARSAPVCGNFLDSNIHHPCPLETAGEAAIPCQLFGDVWEWTSSPYGPYPGYRPVEGTLGEYNGKFMCNQFVLRGGSCATSAKHIRPTYRNFWPPETRFQFSGIRLAR